MSMTNQEKLAKAQIQKYLSEQGYPTYANLLDDFNVNITHRPDVIGYMDPGKGRIVINGSLDIDQVSVTARHEILHEYLTHEKRLLKHLAKRKGLDFETLDDMSLKDLRRALYGNKLFNIAADYEISNRGYTEEDKELIRAIDLNGEIVRGLVTEDDHPDWVDLSVEDMYDKLLDEMEKDADQTDPGQEGDGQNQPPGQEDDKDGESGGKAPNGGNGSDDSDDEDEDSDDSDDDSTSNGGGGKGPTIIKGFMKNGVFYDEDGNEITH